MVWRIPSASSDSSHARSESEVVFASMCFDSSISLQVEAISARKGIVVETPSMTKVSRAFLALTSASSLVFPLMMSFARSES